MFFVGKRIAPQSIRANLTSILKNHDSQTRSSTTLKRVRFADSSQTLPVIPVKSSGFFLGLTACVTVATHKCHAFLDSGAAVNLIKAPIFKEIARVANYDIPSAPTDIHVSGISGNLIIPTCKVYLKVSFSPLEPDVCGEFYVVENASFSAGLLIGYHTMVEANLSLFPATHQIAQNATLISATPPPGSHYPPVVSTATPTASIVLPPSTSALVEPPTVTVEPSVTLAEPADSQSDMLSNTPSHSAPATLVETLSRTEPKLAVLIAPVVVTQGDLCLVRVSVKGVTSGTDIVCIPESSRVKGVAFESVLATVGEDNSCQIAIQNLTNSPLSLKAGVALGDVIPYPVPVAPLDSVHCHAVIPSEPSSEPPSICDQHVGDVDFPERKHELLSLLNHFRQCVSLPGEPLGHTDVIQHAIHLIPDATPAYVPAYRIPVSRRTKVDDAVRDMLAQDVVEPAASPFNAPLLLVPKANGEFRVVVDFRKLNSLTVPDRHPMPVLTDLLQSLGDSNEVFSTVDLQSGFFQVELTPSSRPYTAFTTSTGQYMFKRMAMGLRNSPLTFTRLMNSVLAGLMGNSVFCYLDDVIIASKTVHEHLDTLSEVLSRFAKAGLKLKLSKCSFLKRQISFLGHRVDREGIHALDDKIRAVCQFPTPTHVDQIRSFLGLAGFYRQFIKGFSQIAQPLTALLKKNVPFSWSKDQETAFLSLKNALCHAPVLAFPDFERDFTLCTDASAIGLGAVLMQPDQLGKMRAIAYASRLLNKAECNYSVTHREALAVVWALRHFRDLILGYQIHVRTDHYAVTELFKGNSLTGKFARWQLTVQEFNPSFSYIPGKSNTVADALSRNVAPISLITENHSLPTLEEIKALQRADPFCSKLIYFLESGDASNLPKMHMSPLAFTLTDDVLYKSANVPSHDQSLHNVSQLVIPNSLIEVILYHVHDSPLAGHPGKDRCFRQAQRAYFWPTMRKDITRHCLLCQSCAQHRPSIHFEAKNLAYPIPHAPWDSISVDILKLPLTDNGYQYLLVCVDSFSRFTILVPLKDKSAQSVAQAIINEIICKHASPRALLSDNGAEFNNALLKEICDVFQIKKCNVVAYSPQANGKVERANRRILDILRHITASSSSWDNWIPQVACSLNSAIHSSCNESPHFILYGTDKRLPYEFLSSRPRPLYNLDDYVRTRLADFQRIHQFIHDRLTASQEEMLRKQHQRAVPHEIIVGDLVFLRVHDRHSKLDPRFDGPYRVTESLHGHKFRILNLKTRKEQDVHLDHLKRVDREFDDHSVTPSQPHLSAVPPSPPPASFSPPTQPHPPVPVPTPDTPYRHKLRSHSAISFTFPSPFHSFSF